MLQSLTESMSKMVSCLVAKTIAFGGVPMGSMKAKDVEIVVAIMKALGLTCIALTAHQQPLKQPGRLAGKQMHISTI